MYIFTGGSGAQNSSVETDHFLAARRNSSTLPEQSTYKVNHIVFRFSWESFHKMSGKKYIQHGTPAENTC